MNINSIQTASGLNTAVRAGKEAPVIEAVDIKAILYLGLRGNVSLPAPSRKVDILV